jgi:hypothetical protein
VTARYGVAWGDIVNGQAEIVGVDDQLLERFSKRSAQVQAAFDAKLTEFYTRLGRDPTPKERGALGRQAAADTRGHKANTAMGDLRAHWMAEAAILGITPVSLTADIEAATRRLPDEVPQVTVGEILGELAGRRSAWHRLDVLQAICDTVRPRLGLDGRRWSRALDVAVDRVLEQCIDLDPDTPTARRHSDGRSLWIEPSARHHTSTEILTQEEHLLSWAIDAQLDPPTVSTSVDTDGLDVMQAEAAAAVAGDDRLVLVVGPAGAGKTTMLRAAVENLRHSNRPVFGVAPTAKAARVLQSETGMDCDTVAKLVHEWTRPDRPPELPWRLPQGTTLVVDEAGMAATGDLYHLTVLADHHRWRLVLVGDPHQLQAVGRGGMFTELCASGSTIELDQIHRFHHPWEAAASLKVRHGDPAGLDAYLAHGRISAAPLGEHLDKLAETWAASRAHGEHLAITTATNDHVDAVNHTVQAHRCRIGQLGDRHHYPD